MICVMLKLVPGDVQPVGAEIFRGVGIAPPLAAPKQATRVIARMVFYLLGVDFIRLGRPFECW